MRSSPDDIWAKILVALIAAAAVATGSYLVATATARKASTSQARGDARAYVVQFAILERGLNYMIANREKIEPFARGDGSRVTFSDLKSLGSIMNLRGLLTVERASQKIEQVFPLSYDGPRNCTTSALEGWRKEKANIRQLGRLLANAQPYLAAATGVDANDLAREVNPASIEGPPPCPGRQ